VQLSVPVVASFGGATILSEEVTVRLLASSVATIGGVAMVFTRRAAVRDI
jgi:drug/metabolite transporter (DMT)-like permease